jgi:hypothetical protein
MQKRHIRNALLVTAASAATFVLMAAPSFARR